MLRMGIVCAAASSVSASLPHSEAKADVNVFVVSDLSREGVKETRINIAKFLREKAERGDVLVLYDRPSRRLIGKVLLPNERIFRHFQVRIDKVRPLIGALATFAGKAQDQHLAGLRQKSSVPTAFFKEFADAMRSLFPNERLHVFMHGSAIQENPREPSTAMRKGAYPNDAHLRVDSFNSPYGTIDRRDAHQNVTYHFCYEGSPFLSAAHEENVHRFWALYLSQQGGELATFTHDRQACFARFLSDAKPNREFKLTTGKTNLKMLKSRVEEANKRPAKTPVSIVQEPKKPTPKPKANVAKAPEKRPAIVHIPDGKGRAFLREDAFINRQPARNTFGNLQIGITWGHPCSNVDLDLHVRPAPGASILSWNKTSSGHGKFNKDWLQSPKDGGAYEYIDVTRPVEALKLEIWVNLYGGSCLSEPRGTIRIWLVGEEGVFSREFRIPARKGRGGSAPRNNQNWIKIRPAEILGLRQVRR